MNSIAVIFAVLFFAMTAFCAWLATRLTSARNRAGILDAKVLALEARVAEVARTNRAPEKREKSQASPAQGVSPKPRNPESHTELMDLRKELSKLRDDNKSLRADLKAREKEIQSTRDSVEGRLYVLQEENKRLLEIVKEQDARIASQVKPEDLPAVKELRTEIEKKRQELAMESRRAAELDRSVKPLRDEVASLQDKLSSQQKELARWREAAQLANGRPLDPTLFVRWYRRAQAARETYQMMKRLRELSDHKIELYQESVMRLSAFVLEKLERTPPEVHPGEVLADRWLAEALSALAEHSPRYAPREDEAPSLC